MGSCSNRTLTKSEKLMEHAKKITETRDVFSENFQNSTGAKIRGLIGEKKGNDFINAIKKATQ